MHDAIPRIITFPLIDYVMQRNTWPAKTEQPSAGCGNNYMITEKNNNNTSTTIQQTLVAESNILILPQKTEIMLLHQCREREISHENYRVVDVYCWDFSLVGTTLPPNLSSNIYETLSIETFSLLHDISTENLLCISTQLDFYSFGN